MKRKFKAIIFDIDGTLILNKRDAMPSEKVTRAIAKASSFIHIGVATSRPHFIAKHIISHLKLSGPSIIHGGAQIIDFSSDQVLKEQRIKAADILKIKSITQSINLELTIDEDKESIIMPKNWQPHDLLGAFIHSLDIDVANLLEKKLKDIPSIFPHKIPGWKKGEVVVNISSMSATKEHGIRDIAKLLKISTDEIIGVGDGHNDIPLLKACGFKVAMGNAVPELKIIADYIAPPVEEDGVVDVLEKFVFN